MANRPTTTGSSRSPTGVAEPGATPSRAGQGATYAGAGVDVSAGQEAVERITAAVASTAGPEVIGGVGGFGGLFALPSGRWRQPVLVSSTDGVGTKAALASAAGRYDTIGIDLVAMCVDDVACQGAEPLFMLDHLTMGRLDPALAEVIVAGVAAGCRQAACALVGGEMAEHPGAMGPGCFDLAGFAVGVVERDELLGPPRVRPGDALVGLASPGLRCNGYALARHALLERAGRRLDEAAWPGARRSLIDELLEPSVIYAPALLALGAVGLRAAAHITGGGIAANLGRILPGHCDAVVDRSRWARPAVFDEVQRAGQIADAEMEAVFNLGLGMIAVVPPSEAQAAVATLERHRRPAVVVGQVEPGHGQVRLVGRRRPAGGGEAPPV